MMNDAARELARPRAGDPVGRPVADLGLDPHVVDAADRPRRRRRTGRRRARRHPGASCSTGARRRATARASAPSRRMRDRTELVSLQSQLSSNLSITDTLRAQTHEFANQLHTISGLVQLEEYDEVTALVGTLTRRRAEITRRGHEPASPTPRSPRCRSPRPASRPRRGVVARRSTRRRGCRR